MNGLWYWPSEPKEQAKVLQRIADEDELTIILFALAKNPTGLSNAKIDSLLRNDSQWRTLLHLRELTALGFVGYTVQLFGGPGLYRLTDLGKTIVVDRIPGKSEAA